MNIKVFNLLFRLTFILPLGIISNSNGQNLIQNFSFEDTIPCTLNPDPYSPEASIHWLTLCQSPDYGYQNYCGVGFIPYGFQVPHTGNALIGSGLYSEYVPNSIRETFGQQLSDTLEAGHKYCVSFYISLAEVSNFAIDRIGVLFTSYQIDGNDVFSFSLNPQVQNIPGNIITDTINWVLISGDFIAQGNELFISFGNFYDDQNTQKMQLAFGDTTFKNSYYYFDDISVTDCTVGLPEYIEIQFEIFPNPSIANSEVTVTLSSGFSGMNAISVYSIEGKVLFKQYALFRNGKFTIDSDFGPGVYFLRIENEKGVGVRKFVILQ